MSTITKGDVRKIAMLAQIRVEESELGTIMQEISSILTFVGKLQQADCSFAHDAISDATQQTPQRLDIVHLANTREELLANASEAAFGMFSVPKVVE
jgi:aspartyl-tRNA(Asn)/glutamyl-tRNA(Gln) amidotransferase subunit C